MGVLVGAPQGEARNGCPSCTGVLKGRHMVVVAAEGSIRFHWDFHADVSLLIGIFYESRARDCFFLSVVTQGRG